MSATPFVGYRAQSLEAELKQSLTALETAGVSVQAHTAEISLTPAQESVVALVVREAVTNVVRHAGARNCQVHLSSSDGICLLEIQDDGTGGSSIEGNGLRYARADRSFGRKSAASDLLWNQTDHPVSTRRGDRKWWRLNPPVKEGRKTIRVAPAEDQGMVLGALAALLEIEGDISVIARARTGKEALQAVLTHKPDVFITDIEMPEMTGLDVAAELKRRACHYFDNLCPGRLFAPRPGSWCLRLSVEGYACRTTGRRLSTCQPGITRRRSGTGGGGLGRTRSTHR
jgi:hypothetical protein